MHTANGEMWYVEHGAKFTKEKNREKSSRMYLEKNFKLQ